MKRIAVFLFLISNMAQAQEINFRDGNMSDILKLAKAEKKPVFYMFYASWCSHCNKMKAEVLNNPAVGAFFNANFIAARQDMEIGQGLELRKQYLVKTYPTFVFFDENGTILYRMSGELKADALIREGRNALDTKKQFPYLKSEFSNDLSNSEKALAYISALRKAGIDSQSETEKYVATQTDSQLISAINWKILSNGIHKIESKPFQFILKNQAAFAAVSSPIRVERKIMNIVTETLRPFVDASDTVGYFQNRTSAAAIALPKTDSLIFSYDLRINEQTKNWQNYRKITAASVSKIAWDNASQLKEIAMVYMNNITDKPALKDAILWAERALEINDSYDLYIILGRLNLLIGNQDAARNWAEKGRKIAVSYQWDTKKADEILNQLN